MRTWTCRLRGAEEGGENRSEAAYVHVSSSACKSLSSPNLGPFLSSPLSPRVGPESEKRCYSQDLLLCSPPRASEGGTVQNCMGPVLGEWGVDIRKVQKSGGMIRVTADQPGRGWVWTRLAQVSKAPKSEV